jgi:hypothetical protein
VKVGDLRKLLVHYAMHAHHAIVSNKTQDLDAYHRVDAYIRDPAQSRHEIAMSFPNAVPKLDVRSRQMLLFDWLCELLGEDQELLDYFATRLIERLQDHERHGSKR